MVAIQPACLFVEKELADSSSGGIGDWCKRRTSKDDAAPGRTTSNDDSGEALMIFSGVHSRRKERKRREKRGEREDLCLESQNL
ncbi:hypothetical protein Scep_012250 [Stephania cephalantha]|uniref:Uncharacterized protein n=1 Tax=Stephania cephalantha TaxID=152367 RepID=A0AAP0JGY7_9MAGN